MCFFLSVCVFYSICVLYVLYKSVCVCVSICIYVKRGIVSTWVALWTQMCACVCPPVFLNKFMWRYMWVHAFMCVLQTRRQGLDNGETEGSGLLVYRYSGSLPGREREIPIVWHRKRRRRRREEKPEMSSFKFRRVWDKWTERGRRREAERHTDNWEQKAERKVRARRKRTKTIFSAGNPKGGSALEGKKKESGERGGRKMQNQKVSGSNIWS